MGLEGYQLRSQLGAGRDGIAFRATAPDGLTTTLLLDLTRARGDSVRWPALVRHLRIASQFAHPAAVSILEICLEADAPCAVLEWAGETTLATASAAALPATERATAELLCDVAAALTEAHRQGLAHGRLGPDRVFLTAPGQVKLDFSGVSAGFPRETKCNTAPGAAAAEAGILADLRSADLYGLGELIAWLDRTGDDRAGDEPSAATTREESHLGKLARDLLAADPTERPPARDVLARLERISRPVDATGEWSEPDDRNARLGTSMLATNIVGTREALSRRQPSTRADEPVTLGRYRLLEKLGEGGQGVVYRALDPAEQTVVAIKVLRSERAAHPVVLRRFRKEARLLAEANNPYVVNLLEYNEDNGVHYLVLELVTGANLGDLLEERSRLEVPEALSIMAGVARGLTQAHDRGIVHRDIKPGNILLLGQFTRSAVLLGETIDDIATGQSRSEAARQRVATSAVARTATLGDTGNGDASTPRVKITDFGLARHVVDTESLAMTEAGAILGTPRYMAPEQWTGRIVDPRTDVYAMGATLYHLLAGQPPFSGETRDQLCQQHCNEQPLSLSQLNPGVSEGVARAVHRALSKSPDDRFPDAAAMLRDLEALRLGKPTDLAIHPALPECDPARILRFEFRWDLESSPRELWPLVTNTDRLDRAIGFPPVTYRTRFEPGRGVRTFAEGRKAGMSEVGEEFPYEWVEPRRMGILRTYSQGPFKWLVSSVELLPRPGGGTTLIHALRLEPSTWTIRVGSRWGVGVGMRKSLEKVYRRIDATLRSQRRRGAARVVDPFEEPGRVRTPARQRLERLMDRLVERSVDVAVVDRLAEYLTAGSAQAVARIRPIALAERLELDPDQVVAACLHGAREGLLELHWDLLCPVCRVSARVTDTLREIAEHAHCQACHLDFELDFANSIELIFRVHPEIRESDLGTYCVGGPAHSPHVVAQMRVAPGERIELELELPEGSYLLRGPQLPWSADFRVEKSAACRRWDIDLVAGPSISRPAAIRAGAQVFAFHNTSERELLIRVERTAPRKDALTAARAASLPLFRELFPGEVLAPGRLATVSSVSLLSTSIDPARADALYRELGDAGAFAVIHEHLQKVGDAIRVGGGAVVKTMGEGVLASFSHMTAAVETALALSSRLDRGSPPALSGLRLGVHKGPALAATVNDQLDYFGTTARDAVAVLSQAEDDDLMLTEPVASDPAVASLLIERGIETEIVPTSLAGHRHLIRIRLGNVRLMSDRPTSSI
jgi:serine/threonine protein kinase